MAVTHAPWLVVLSVILAVQGSYVGLGLAVRGAGASGSRRRLLLASAAISLALAIWTMHFVGMLAARLAFPVDYLVVPTLLSFLVCVIVVGAAVLAASLGPPTLPRLASAAVFMGFGIASMHYIGMQALHASAHMVHGPFSVAASVAVAIVASGLALWLAVGRPLHSLVFSATALGLAISGMHYTAMAGLKLYPHAMAPTPAPVLSTDLLAIVVALVAFLVSGGFLLILVPDRSSEARDEAPPISTAAMEGGAAATPPRQSDLASAIAVERDGGIQHIPVESIVAVQANAHYTTVFDGVARHFCPLSIGEIEQQLDPRQFVRVHRSHIVNVERIAAMRRAGDNGLVELDAPDRCTVPISRGRMGSIKARLAAMPSRLAARPATGQRL